MQFDPVKSVEEAIKYDPYLRPYRSAIEARMFHFAGLFSHINTRYGSIQNFAATYKEYGLHKVGNKNHYKEWLPNARKAYLVGDFNRWSRSHQLIKDSHDEEIMAIQFEECIPECSRLRVCSFLTLSRLK